MSYTGIDYGLGRSNINHDTGIRYGVISQYSVMGEALNDMQPEYGEMECAKCGHSLKIEDSECPHCGADMHNEFDCVEPIGFSYEQEGYSLVDCLDSDIMILNSPFYTFAQFCSPCVPGAGNLDNPMDDGIKTYCLGHDWFENGKAPYPVYKVDDDSLVIA